MQQQKTSRKIYILGDKRETTPKRTRPMKRKRETKTIMVGVVREGNEQERMLLGHRDVRNQAKETSC